MTGDLGFIIASAALIMSTAVLLTAKSIFEEQRLAMQKIWSRLRYLEVAMSYHDMVPLPWENEEFNEKFEDMEKTRKFKRAGNVVYMEQEGD